MADLPLMKLPQVPSVTLPTAELRAPLPAREDRPDAATHTDADAIALAELLEPGISAIIARKARQRRYTP